MLRTGLYGSDMPLPPRLCNCKLRLRLHERRVWVLVEFMTGGAVVVNVSDSHNALVMDAREIASLCYPEGGPDPSPAERAEAAASRSA